MADQEMKKYYAKYVLGKALPVEDEIPSAYVVIDNDLAVENMENDFDMTAADRQDFKRRME